jgi:hypothetical protein
MPEKILRLGYTESTLLFIYWLNHHKNINNREIIQMKKSMISWLYTTSGYYDTTQHGHYFNVIHYEEHPAAYTAYMTTIYDFIKDSDIYEFIIHNMARVQSEFDEFKQIINPKITAHISHKIVFNFIAHKKILIISPFAKLIKAQIESGNCKVIYPDTPIIASINIYTFPYTFFNKGSHNNILETTEHIFNNIINTITEEYDSVLISCGAYSCLIAKKFYDVGKNVCTVGGDIQSYFGILNGRVKTWNNNNFPTENREYWIINIPDEYKPADYDKIENGCYW